MEITFDPAKRALTLRHRGLDFADAAAVFAGRHATILDARRDYGERRFITAGWLGKRMVVLVWTPRGDTRRIISMEVCTCQGSETLARSVGLIPTMHRN